MCVHAGLYVCVYVSQYARRFEKRFFITNWMGQLAWVTSQTQRHTHTDACVYMPICVRLWMWICMWMCVFVWLYVGMNIFVFVHVHEHAWVCECMFMCVCVSHGRAPSWTHQHAGSRRGGGLWSITFRNPTRDIPPRAWCSALPTNPDDRHTLPYLIN